MHSTPGDFYRFLKPVPPSSSAKQISFPIKSVQFSSQQNEITEGKKRRNKQNKTSVSVSPVEPYLVQSQFTFSPPLPSRKRHPKLPRNYSRRLRQETGIGRNNSITDFYKQDKQARCRTALLGEDGLLRNVRVSLICEIRCCTIHRWARVPVTLTQTCRHSDVTHV